MAKVSVKKFIEVVQRSNLVDEAALRDALLVCKERHEGALPHDVLAVADFLVEQNLVSKWHADKLLDGKYKGFFLGKYKLLDHLGTGGMSSVFLAEHTLMHQRRAIKVLPKKRLHDSSYLERFYLEARASAALDHPNIVRAYDIDSEGDTHYFVMEFVQGRDVQQIINQNGALDYKTAVSFCAQTAAGLEHAHDVGLIHRDIKPANLLVDKNNVVKILDLGLALFKNDEAASLTMAHNENVLGTADYLSPEQAINSHDIDKRADIYSLGCTFYFMLTGHAPFPEGTLAQRIAKHQMQMPSDIRDDRPDCPDELVEVCMKMIQKKPDDRFQTVREIRDVLEAWLLAQGYLDEQRKPDSSIKLAAVATTATKTATVSGDSSKPTFGVDTKKTPRPLKVAQPLEPPSSDLETQARPTPAASDTDEIAAAPTTPSLPGASDTALPFAEPFEETVEIPAESSPVKSEPKPQPPASLADITPSDQTTSLLEERRARQRKGSGTKNPLLIKIGIAVGAGLVVIVVVLAIILGGGKEEKDPDRKRPEPRKDGFRAPTVLLDECSSTASTPTALS